MTLTDLSNNIVFNYKGKQIFFKSKIDLLPQVDKLIRMIYKTTINVYQFVVPRLYKEIIGVELIGIYIIRIINII